MSTPDKVILKRDVEAAVVPVGTKVTLVAGETAYITQALGGTYSVVVNGNMFRISGADADALGLEASSRPASAPGKPQTREEVEQEVWRVLKTCYDPEIPVNIVDLGLIYDMVLEPLPSGKNRVSIKMTLTAPGCGMGPVIARDAQEKILDLPAVEEANVEIVWDPPWHQSMITAEGRRILGLE